MTKVQARTVGELAALLESLPRDLPVYIGDDEYCLPLEMIVASIGKDASGSLSVCDPSETSPTREAAIIGWRL